MNSNQKFLEEITGLSLNKIEQHVVEGQRMYKVSDLCGQLRIINTSVAMHNVDKEHKKKVPIGAINAGSNDVTVRAWFVSEIGIYQIILHNRTDVTKRIRDRIATELLPCIEV